MPAHRGQPLAAQGDIGGSNRKLKARWRYAPGVNTRSAFIELKDMTMEPPEFMERLGKVEGVAKVDLTRRGDKASQGNIDCCPGDPTRGHRQLQMFEVWCNKYPNHPVEFQLTRSRYICAHRPALGSPQTYVYTRVHTRGICMLSVFAPSVCILLGSTTLSCSL